jgi:hypothetical protein
MKNRKLKQKISNTLKSFKKAFQPKQHQSSGQTSLPLKPSTPSTPQIISLSSRIPTKPLTSKRPTNQSSLGTKSTLKPSRPKSKKNK